MSVPVESKRITISTFKKMKAEKKKIACLTAYDASFAAVLEDAGVELILVGDSLGMVIKGFETTVPVTMDDMVYHSQCVVRGSRRALVVADMPFMSYYSPEQALMNAASLMQQGGVQMVKLESSTTQIETVRRLSDQGVPVCAHLGLRPQSIHKLGGYKVQGKDERSATLMLEDALSLQEVGAVILLLECVPSLLAAEITANVDIPVIGIGAGMDCDGQILVLQDLLGITTGKVPRFAHNFIEGGKTIQEAVRSYVDAVKNHDFPAARHSF
ncbi:MAG: 3-methyl-2-oxobutanoate hydroxymethyltransferase [Pseudomonadota bacterium]